MPINPSLVGRGTEAIGAYGTDRAGEEAENETLLLYFDLLF